LVAIVVLACVAGSIESMSAFAYHLPDTGQTQCYDNDGNPISCPARYRIRCEDSTSRDGKGYCNYVKIDHGNGHMTLYGHLAEGSVPDDIYKGKNITNPWQTPLGNMGNTGFVIGATGVHLHFGVYYDQKPYNLSVKQLQGAFRSVLQLLLF